MNKTFKQAEHASRAEGSVTKQGGRIKNWKKRWCVLDEEGLHYYKTQHTTEKGSIAIETIISCSGEERLSSKRKNCFQVTTTERTYRICATDSLDKDEWVTSLNKLLKSRTGSVNNGNNNNHSNGSSLKSSSGHVDINRLKIENNENDTSSESSSYSSTFTRDVGHSNTISLTPIMLSLKDKFGHPNFSLELNKKRDLLSIEEVETIMKLLDGHIKSEIEDSTKEYDREIVEIIKQIYKLRDAEIEAVEEKYRKEKYEILAEISRIDGK
ncbi:hypothetical protein PPL_11895 [Heterostelium album PN500]|uniref:PH domain-containing protein n=1 Tax=Heterostelium pallidum (strain ATCC 26659 / Pp 5 / PN500) TaxID=670386 RepID=D3BUS3_HETP5|nr:hypothetical protein PPL_11895 [Heterostelium album PN500]EFA74861.1 hypothetical protein PPL_11895 [Heterostelium album PN500]|eukprot:XP_020426995.1 hypothetical protein PPL_11895 [Heterostelium album PN500]